MAKADPLDAVAKKIEAAFATRRVRLTIGGEPTYVPLDPQGPEWTVLALGPTKQRYAYALADALIAQAIPNALAVLSPGKSYPGEVNPRWAIQLVWNRDGSVLVPGLAKKTEGGTPDKKNVDAFCKGLLQKLKLDSGWLNGIDPEDEERVVRVLPLDHNGKKFVTENWELDGDIELLHTDGPAGLRLPLHLLPDDANRRALTVEVVGGKLHVFLPPFLQPGFLALLEAITVALSDAKLGTVFYGGYVPGDEGKLWNKLAIAADPGVIEINLPPCATWREYRDWMMILEKAAATAGLRSWKEFYGGDAVGTGGGNHLLFGGPSLDENPLFKHPRWVSSMMRYWQHHPSLAYLFTGQYVGPSSQAPRPDESSSGHYDLEMAYRFLEKLPEGDNRLLISETLRHLHTDGTGNTHRSEASFDKFWNVNFDGGCRGLIEFRAIETLPHAEWMSAVALVWHALAAMLLAKPFTKPLVEHGDALHDRYFLPSFIWADFERVLRDLKGAGFALPLEPYRTIAAWRFPTMLEHGTGSADLTVRRGLEGWPLLCETPLEGGNTSRFVDTSMERLEFSASRAFAEKCCVFVGGRRLELQPFPDGRFGAGLRYRRTSLYPSLHPGIPPQLPLYLTIVNGKSVTAFKLGADQRTFAPCDIKEAPATSRRECGCLRPGLVTCDLRLA